MAPDPAGDGAEAGPLTSATPALPGRSPKPRISYSIEYASRRLKVAAQVGWQEDSGSQGSSEVGSTARRRLKFTALTDSDRMSPCGT